MKLNYRKILNLRRLASSPKQLLTALIVFGLALFFSTCASTQTLSGSVERVIDGDTIRLVDGEGKSHRVRFFGIDAPESKQPYGEEATAFLASQIEGKKVKIIIKTKSDKYGRIVGVVQSEGRDINKIMVERGLAWAYSYYTDAYLPQHRLAREQGVGLWADENATEPYKWRKKHKGFVDDSGK